MGGWRYPSNALKLILKTFLIFLIIPLALLLHDMGYDVWLGNARGNTYSRTHTRLNPESRSFWDFSWHEIGYYDMPTMVDHIISTTGVQQLDYVGHSQGVTTFLVMNMLRPEYQAVFKTAILLSPIAFLSNIENPYLRFLAKNSEKVELMLELLQIYELLPSNQVNGVLASILCSESSPAQDLCANLLFLAIGPDPIHLNRVRIIRKMIDGRYIDFWISFSFPDLVTRDLPKHSCRNLHQTVPSLW